MLSTKELLICCFMLFILHGNNIMGVYFQVDIVSNADGQVIPQVK